MKGLKASLDCFKNGKDGPWAILSKNDEEVTKIKGVVREGHINKVGQRDTILFWKDMWCTSNPLKVLHPRLYGSLHSKMQQLKE